MEMKLAEKPSKTLLGKWRRMTWYNRHKEVRVDIAKYFGDSINPEGHGHPYGFEASFREIMNTAHRFQTDSLLTASNLLTELMVGRIGEIYGEDVAKAVADCL